MIFIPNMVPFTLRSANDIEVHTVPEIALKVIKRGEVTFVHNGIFAMKWAGYYLYEDAPGILLLVDDEYDKVFLWEVETSFVPVDPAERAAGWGMLTGLVRQDMEKGLTKDWGAFVGELSGCAIAEGTEEEIHQQMIQYVPFVNFEIHQLIALDKVENIIKAMAG